MANNNCQACNDLAENAAEFVANGVTDNVCTSLQNNTGFDTGNSRNNCTDLNDAVDCLVGNVGDEINAYDNCDWRDYMRRLVPNLYHVLKALVCWLCGLQKKVDKHDCEINYLINGFDISVGEKPTDSSYVVAGKGVSYLIPVGTEYGKADVSLRSYGGSYGRLTGSYQFFLEDFTDSGQAMNFDNDKTEYETSNKRLGNPVWGTAPPNLIAGGELISEMRIKRSDFPFLRSLTSGFGIETTGTPFHVRVAIFNAGDYAFGQHGWCKEDGSPQGPGHSRGHKVPDGWTYVQLRMNSIFVPITNNSQHSPMTTLAVRVNRNGMDC